MRKFLWLLLLVPFVSGVQGVELPGIISSNMVLQRDVDLPIWGFGDDGEKVTVTFLDKKVSTVVKDGAWMVKLPPAKAGGPFTMTVEGKDKIEMDNILVGEVWLCSGQSNMEWQVQGSTGWAEEKKDATNPNLRLFTPPKDPKKTALYSSLKTVKGRWKECNPVAAGTFSGVAYFFGKSLQKTLNVPVGLINSSVGGTVIESWMSAEALSLSKENGLNELAAKSYSEYLAKVKANNEKVAAWRKEKEAGEKKPVPTVNSQNILYNMMIAPLIPYPLKGVLWYQGESNRDANKYRAMMPELIRSWRREWNNEFPFFMVQLPYCSSKGWDYTNIREVQFQTVQNTPKTAIAVTTDVGDKEAVHPPNKKPVGERLALCARALAYGEKIEYSGPFYDKMKVDGDKIILSFTHVGKGLEAKGDVLRGFNIAGADGVFQKGDADIVGDTVVVKNSAISKPAAVRYGFEASTDVNLYNKDGLPASPFRTDTK